MPLEPRLGFASAAKGKAEVARRLSLANNYLDVSATRAHKKKLDQAWQHLFWLWSSANLKASQSRSWCSNLCLLVEPRLDEQRCQDPQKGKCCV